MSASSLWRGCGRLQHFLHKQRALKPAPNVSRATHSRRLASLSKVQQHVKAASYSPSGFASNVPLQQCSGCQTWHVCLYTITDDDDQTMQLWAHSLWLLMYMRFVLARSYCYRVWFCDEQFVVWWTCCMAAFAEVGSRRLWIQWLLLRHYLLTKYFARSYPNQSVSSASMIAASLMMF